MSSHSKGSTMHQLDKFTLNTTKKRTKALIAALLEHEPVEFMLRSLYKKDNDNTNITKRILDVIDLKTCSRESELIESLLSAASQIPHGVKFIDDKKTFGSLLELQKYKLKERLDPKKKTVSVYFPDSAYREQVGDILNKLRKINYNAITFVGTICNDKHEKEEYVYYGGHGIIEQMDFVDLVICATYAHDLPKNAKKVYFMHDIHDSPVSKEENVLKMILEYDYHFVPSHSVLERVKKQISLASAEGYLKEEKEIGLIQGGYIKLDQNLKLFKKYKKEEKVLIHAPTVTDPDIEDYACLPKHSEKIIDTLLENFPDYKIIFRPHPHTLKIPAVSRIVDKHRDNPRFAFDNNASFYMRNYAKSALMVTDFSGTAFTYAFTTLRPVVFFSHNESAFQKAFEGYHFVQDRSKVGTVAQNTEELVKNIKSLLKKNNGFKTKIKKYRDSLIYNMGNSENYFVENINFILNGQKHKDWIYLKAEPTPPQLVEEGYSGFNIVYFNNKFFALSQELGSINLEKVNLSEVDINLKFFVGVSKSEVKGYVDWLTNSKELLVESQAQNLELDRLKNIIVTKERNEKILTRELEEKVGLLEQLMIEASNFDKRAEALSKEREENHQKTMALKQEVTDSKIRIDTLQTEIENKHSTIESLSNASEDKTLQIDLLRKEIKEKGSQITTLINESAENKLKIKSLEVETESKNSQIETLSRELQLREKWVQLLREKYRTTTNQNTDFSHELEKIKTSFLYRLIK